MWTWEDRLTVFPPGKLTRQSESKVSLYRFSFPQVLGFYLSQLQSRNYRVIVLVQKLEIANVLAQNEQE